MKKITDELNNLNNYIITLEENNNIYNNINDDYHIIKSDEKIIYKLYLKNK